jgi:hypothetical protein
MAALRSSTTATGAVALVLVAVACGEDAGAASILSSVVTVHQYGDAYELQVVHASERKHKHVEHCDITYTPTTRIVGAA